MKLYKLFLSVMMVFSFVLCLCACEKKPKNELIQEGKLIMATNAYFPPYEYYSGDEIVGIDIEIGQAIADSMGVELEVKNMPFEEVVDSVKDGEADVAISTLTITDERKKIVDFSEPYANGIQAIIVKEDSDISSAEDLSNAKKIGVQKGATGEMFCIDDFGEDKVTSYNKISVALLDMNSGDIDAIVIDKDIAEKLVKENAGLKMLDSEYKNEEYAIVIQKGNARLLDDVNKVIKELKDSGKIDEIVKNYNNE